MRATAIGKNRREPQEFGSEILELEGTGGRWQVDHAVEKRLPDGRRPDLSV